MISEFSYNFPALRGNQSGKEYYVVMVPLNLIPKIFLFDKEELQPEIRSRHILNKSRIPDIVNNMLEHHKEYIFSSFTASIDGEIQFKPYSDDLNFKDLGNLLVSLDSRFLVNDGQHRVTAIEEVLKVSPELGTETISVVFLHD
ncbi:DNA sulfur modification protein DndB [Niallia taxi]|uniref:DNA sulfur modification protein DndB n=1 Tax=Niallia taxi TaxID=2499688 RepID=UPI003D279D0D